MNKKNWIMGAAVLIGIALVGFSAQGVQAAGLRDDSVTPTCQQIGQGIRGLAGNGQGFGRANAAAGTPAQAQNGAGLALLPGGEVSQVEAEALLFMLEEEKLARDVYAFLYQTWGATTFQSISNSEQAHMQAVKTLLDTYGLQDPDTGSAGAFTNPDLQALYNELTAQGSLSLADAYKVGAAIEEIDILDLQESLAETDQADIQQVYNNLLNGSYNHLRAFANALSNQTGETYQPQYLSAESYAEGIASTPGNGQRGSINPGGYGQSGAGGRRGQP